MLDIEERAEKASRAADAAAAAASAQFGEADEDENIVGSGSSDSDDDDDDDDRVSDSDSEEGSDVAQAELEMRRAGKYDWLTSHISARKKLLPTQHSSGLPLRQDTCVFQDWRVAFPHFREYFPLFPLKQGATTLQLALSNATLCWLDPGIFFREIWDPSWLKCPKCKKCGCNVRAIRRLGFDSERRLCVKCDGTIEIVVVVRWQHIGCEMRKVQCETERICRQARARGGESSFDPAFRLAAGARWCYWIDARWVARGWCWFTHDSASFGTVHNTCYRGCARCSS